MSLMCAMVNASIWSEGRESHRKKIALATRRAPVHDVRVGDTCVVWAFFGL